jgi:hypothetical protein
VPYLTRKVFAYHSCPKFVFFAILPSSRWKNAVLIPYLASRLQKHGDVVVQCSESAQKAADGKNRPKAAISFDNRDAHFNQLLRGIVE